MGSSWEPITVLCLQPERQPQAVKHTVKGRCKIHLVGQAQKARRPDGTIKLRTRQPSHPCVVPCKMSQSKNQPCWGSARVTAQQWCSSKCENNLAYRLDNFVETEWWCQESCRFLEGAESLLLFRQKSHGN